MTIMWRRFAVLAGVSALFVVANDTVNLRGATAASRFEEAAQRYREVTLPAGTRLRLKLASSYSSASNRVEDKVDATLATSVRAGNATALPAGSQIDGVVSAVSRPGKVKGRGAIGLSFTEIVVDGERYPISASYRRVAPATKGEDAAKIGIPAAGGAIIGGLIGGKKGAITGGAIGGGAGTAVVLTTRGKDAAIGRGAILTVTLRQALTVRVPIR